MTEKEMKEALELLKEFREIDVLVEHLNLVGRDKGDPLSWSIDARVLRYVDAELAAKGLLSLLLERSAKIRVRLDELRIT